jgi:hypothetical protein
MSSKPAGQTGGFFRIFIAGLNRRPARPAWSQIRLGESRSGQVPKM